MQPSPDIQNVLAWISILAPCIKNTPTLHRLARANAPSASEEAVFRPANSRTRISKEAHKPVEFIELKAEDHHLHDEDTRIAMIAASVKFVKEHNPPD